MSTFISHLFSRVSSSKIILTSGRNVFGSSPTSRRFTNTNHNNFVKTIAVIRMPSPSTLIGNVFVSYINRVGTAVSNAEFKIR